MVTIHYQWWILKFQAGLISDSDDEVVFVGFDLPAEEEETELGMTSSSSATSVSSQWHSTFVKSRSDLIIITGHFLLSIWI